MFGAGGAVAGVKIVLNGTKERVKALEDVSKVAAASQNEMRERMVRVETKIDGLSAKLDRI